MVFNSPHLLSRRGFCLCCLGSATFAATGGYLTPRQAFAQARTLVDQMRSDAAEAPIKLHPLRRNISVIEGSGGNIAVLTGDDGKLLVDAGITASRPKIVAALATLGAAPIRYLINTHWHFDHADGNEWLHGMGATIIAHENTKKHLAAAQRVEDWNFDFPPSPAGAVPTELFETGRILDVNNSKLSLMLRGPAHTDGDVFVDFPEADILHTGDTYWNGIYPFIDYSTGGSIDGMIKATDDSLARATSSTIVIPGHGHPVSNKSELHDYREMLVRVRDNVARLKQQGRSLQETIAAGPTAAFDAKWGQFVVDPSFFTKLVYQGV